MVCCGNLVTLGCQTSAFSAADKQNNNNMSRPQMTSVLSETKVISRLNNQPLKSTNNECDEFQCCLFFFPRQRFLGYRWRAYRIIIWNVGACRGKSFVLRVFLVAPPFYPLVDTFLFSCSFLVDACMMLTAHINTEGLFRKSGSVVRLKALKVKNDRRSTPQPLMLPDLGGS